MGEVRKEIFQVPPRIANLRQGVVLISSFLTSTGRQSSEQRYFGLPVRQRGGIL